MNNNKSQFFGTKKEIIEWLDRHKIKNYTINDDLSVDVNGDVNISHRKLKTIPVKFGKIAGDFWCDNNKLINLAGTPEIVGKHFCGDNNELTNLAGSPKSIDGNFWCVDSPIISLLEVINCNFKGEFYFNIDAENFKPKELIQTLEQYYDKAMTRYELTNSQFSDTIKPQIEKEILQQKLKTLKTKAKTKTNFI